ncbi:MAG: hypothetical protein ACP5M5_03860 [Acidibrevibacterium sp.]|uniref:hypothetical protein n=1 Tax=Acidibrevibacterium sp. TaxID=2606776 RepID=UPI003D01D27B
MMMISVLPALAEEGSTSTPGATTAPTRTEIFQSGHSQTVIDQDQLSKVGPMASPAQGMVFTPGGRATSPGLIGGPGGRVMLDGLGAGGR